MKIENLKKIFLKKKNKLWAKYCETTDVKYPPAESPATIIFVKSTCFLIISLSVESAHFTAPIQSSTAAGNWCSNFIC